MGMSEDDPETSVPAAVTTDVLAAVPSSTPILAQPQFLVDGFRYLQQRIPEFTHLTLKEKRSHTRAANLDPEFIESGLQAAAVWPHTKAIVDRSAEELRGEQEEIRRWDEVIVELRAITDGIESANLKRKHRLGRAILQIYQMMGAQLHNAGPEDIKMRPYYENMKRASLRTQRFRKGKKKEGAEGE